MEKENKVKENKKNIKNSGNENKESEKLKEENKSLNEKLLRVMAEMQNIKRHNEEEKMNLCKYDGEDLIKKLLPIVDNFERAILLDDANLSDDLSKFLEGFKMIYGNIQSVLKDKNIKEIECINNDFDPSMMEAVLTEKIDGMEPGKVIDVLQKGYIYNDKVIRHAMVKVSE